MKPATHEESPTLLNSLLAKFKDNLNGLSVKAAAPSKSAITLNDLVCRIPIVTIPKIAEKVGITYPTAKQVVNELVKLGILGPYGDKERVSA